MARILLVDDDPDVLRFVRRLLAQAEHDVLTAADAMEAIDVLNANQCDLLLTDANMPAYSGFDLVKTLRNDTRYDKMAIAMLTGRRERKDIERAVMLKVDDYIVKPIDPMLLLKKVEDLLSKKPAANRPAVQFAEANIHATGRLAVDIEIAAISELGVVLLTPQPFTEGTLVHLTADIFTDMGIDAPMTKVLSSVKRNDGSFETRLNFIGATDSVLQRIRAWIMAKTPRHGSRAS